MSRIFTRPVSAFGGRACQRSCDVTSRVAVGSAHGWGPREVDLERRIVTILFADLVGFTSLSERLDAEDVATIQDAYFGVLRETVARYGGRLEKFIGGAAMAVFGLPQTREDHAERAVRAGLAIVAAVEALGPRLGVSADDLRVRVGVNTGEAVTAPSGPDSGRVTGDTVNTAARLQVAAPPGGVLIGEATALAVAAAIDLTPVEPVRLKGKPTRSTQTSQRGRSIRLLQTLAEASADEVWEAARIEGDLGIVQSRGLGPWPEPDTLSR